MARFTEKMLQKQIDCLNGSSDHEFYLGHNGYGYYVTDETTRAAEVDSGMTAKECHLLLKGMQCAFSVDKYGHI